MLQRSKIIEIVDCRKSWGGVTFFDVFENTPAIAILTYGTVYLCEPGPVRRKRKYEISTGTAICSARINADTPFLRSPHDYAKAMCVWKDHLVVSRGWENKLDIYSI